MIFVCLIFVVKIRIFRGRGSKMSNPNWKCSVSARHMSAPMGSFLKRSERRLLEGIMRALNLKHWPNVFPALCTLPAPKRTLARVLDCPQLSANRLHFAVHVFANMIRRVAGGGLQRQTRHKSRVRTAVLNTIQKVIFQSSSHASDDPAAPGHFWYWLSSRPFASTTSS